MSKLKIEVELDYDDYMEYVENMGGTEPMPYEDIGAIFSEHFSDYHIVSITKDDEDFN